MAVDVERLVLQLSADIRRMERGLDRARRQTDTATRAIEQRFETMSGRVSRSGEQMADSLRQSIAAIGVGVAVREVQTYADAWTTARNRLAAAGVATGDLADTQARLVQLSLQTRTGLESTVDLYARLIRSTRDLGVSQDQVFRATQILNQAFIAGGASVSEQTAAIQQLGQALASGALQGDELRSLRENAPLLAQAIADEFGVTIGKLKELGAEGQLTTDRVFQGILRAGQAIDTQFGSTVSTVSQAFTNLQTAAIQYFGTVDQNLGVSQKLAGLIQQVADNLDLLGYAAIAAAGALAARGLPAAISAVSDRFREAIKVFGATGEALQQRAQQLRELARIQAGELEVARTRVGVANAELASIFNRVKSTRALVDYYEQLQDAERELVRSSAALDEANRVAGTNEKPRMLAIQSQTLATHRLQEAQSRLARLQDHMPTGLRNVMAAQHDLTAAQQDAALKAQQLEQTQQSLARATRESSRATALFRATLSSFGALIAGTAGSIAVFAALTFAIKAIDDAFVTSAEAIEQAEAALSSYRDATQAIEQDTARLESANEALRKAIEAQGPAAQDTARLEVDAINQRIAANRKLQGLYQDQARLALADARRAQRREANSQDVELNAIAFSAPNALGGDQRALSRSARLEAAIAEARRAVDAGESINKSQRRLLEILTKREATAARIQDLSDIVEGRGQADTPLAAVSTTVTGGGGTTPEGDRTSGLRAFRTDLEDLQRTLKEVTASKADDAEKSRAAVQAILDYASATRDVAAAYGELPAVSDLLNPEDAALLNTELRKLADDTIAQVGTAFTALSDQFLARAEEIDRARRAAIAAGIEDLSRFDAAAEQSLREFTEAWEDLTDVPNPFEDLMEIETGDLPEFEAIGAAFREQMRESLREALRQGITTNDWGDALRSVIATAVTRGFEDAINRFADFLSDILLGQGNSRGVLGSIASGIGGIFSGHRANGGPVNAGGTYRINEAGKGELLYMGRPGQVLTTAQLAQMLPGSSGRSVTISTPVIFNGPVGADLGEVQQLMNQRDQKLMQILPRAIDARVMDSSMRRRFR